MGIFDNLKNKAKDMAEKAKEQGGQGGQGGQGQPSDSGGQPGQAGGQAGGQPGQAGDGGMTDRAGDMADRAGNTINERTGGKYEDQVDQGVNVAKQRLGNADESARADADQRRP